MAGQPEAPHEERSGRARGGGGRVARLGNLFMTGLLVLLAFNLLWMWRSCEALGPVGTGKPAPDFALDAMDHSTVRLRDLRGKVVALNFWATWCAPCIAEMPVLENLARRYSGKGLVVLAVNVAERREDIEAFLRVRPIGLPILRDDGRVSERYHVGSLPMLVLVDRLGIVRARELGMAGESHLASRIEPLLAAPPPRAP